jgi:hypothetical protein
VSRWVFCASVCYVVLALANSAHANGVPVPEIDAAGATTALGLLAGLVTLFAERFRHK